MQECDHFFLKKGYLRGLSLYQKSRQRIIMMWGAQSRSGLKKKLWLKRWKPELTLCYEESSITNNKIIFKRCGIKHKLSKNNTSNTNNVRGTPCVESVFDWKAWKEMWWQNMAIIWSRCLIGVHRSTKERSQLHNQAKCTSSFKDSPLEQKNVARVCLHCIKVTTWMDRAFCSCVISKDKGTLPCLPPAFSAVNSPSTASLPLLGLLTNYISKV